ncbi:hypothetical protein M0812_17632 [Anaeramoeba flamelloides]|uniref:MSP domain-containing protein n=1 Tax=Anaeramoeba flamelloides TaxID=1746091 RepID=A0AAV7ZEQ1_9EUKA|nr:hypothetical protein M0812_17632 [Anaeramoeba flamelloides]
MSTRVNILSNVEVKPSVVVYSKNSKKVQESIFTISNNNSFRIAFYIRTSSPEDFSFSVTAGYIDSLSSMKIELIYQPNILTKDHNSQLCEIIYYKSKETKVTVIQKRLRTMSFEKLGRIIFTIKFSDKVTTLLLQKKQKFNQLPAEFLSSLSPNVKKTIKEFKTFSKTNKKNFMMKKKKINDMKEKIRPSLFDIHVKKESLWNIALETNTSEYVKLIGTLCLVYLVLFLLSLIIL